MKTRYLCPKHRAAVRVNQKLAYALWRGATLHGHKAYSEKNCLSARSFLGSAFEIGRIQKYGFSGTNNAGLLNEYCLSSCLFADTLCFSAHFEEAEEVLRYLLDTVQTRSAQSHGHGEAQALRYLIRERLIQCLQINGKYHEAMLIELEDKTLGSQLKQTLSH